MAARAAAASAPRPRTQESCRGSSRGGTGRTRPRTQESLLRGSASLPSLRQGAGSLLSERPRTSPLQQPQPLCTVTVGGRQVRHELVHGRGLGPASVKRLPFCAYDPGTKAYGALADGDLPPLEEVLDSFFSELGLSLPDKAAKDLEGASRCSEAKYRPYRKGPRLPLRRHLHAGTCMPDLLAADRRALQGQLGAALGAMRSGASFTAEGLKSAAVSRRQSGAFQRDTLAVKRGSRAGEGWKSAAVSRRQSGASQRGTLAVPRGSYAAEAQPRGSTLAVPRGSRAAEANPLVQAADQAARAWGSQLQRRMTGRSSFCVDRGPGEDVNKRGSLPVVAPQTSIDEMVIELPWGDDEMRSVFAKFDWDRDGEVHTDTLHAMLRGLGCFPEVGDAERLVQQQTRFSTLSYEEFVEFVRAYRRLDLSRLWDQYEDADLNKDGHLDFRELHSLLQRMGFSPTTMATMEALKELDRNLDERLSFEEFQGLRDFLRQTEGMTRAECQELKELHDKVIPGLVDPDLMEKECWRICSYVGYPFSEQEFVKWDLLNNLDYDDEKEDGLSFAELLQVVRKVREKERESLAELMARHGRPKGAGDLVGYVTPAEGTWADCFPTEDLGYVLSDFGYVTSVEAVYECLDKFDEVEEEDSLTIEELALFLREYRKVEGFTHAEIAEFEAAFQAAVSEQATMSAPSGARDEARGLDTLAVGRVLRWFGISTNLQQVHQLLEELDFDNSGLIEFTEFIKMMRRLYQDHANQVRFLFNKLDRQRSGLIPVSELPNAVLVFEGALGDPDLVATARAQAKLPETGFVDRPGFEEFFRQWRKVAIDQVRARAGYSTLEVSRLREAFQTIDRDNSGTIEKEEFQELIRTYFPDALKSRSEQQDVVRLIKAVDGDGNEAIDFNEFLHLLRKCDDMRDSADIKLEKEVVKECGFSQEEADGFRQIFADNIGWTGELNVPKLAELLGKVIYLTEARTVELTELVKSVHPHGRPVARFPQFLRLIKQLTEENYGGLNIKAARKAESELAMQAQKSNERVMERQRGKDDKRRRAGDARAAVAPKDPKSEEPSHAQKPRSTRRRGAQTLVGTPTSPQPGEPWEALRLIQQAHSAPVTPQQQFGSIGEDEADKE